MDKMLLRKTENDYNVSSKISERSKEENIMNKKNVSVDRKRGFMVSIIGILLSLTTLIVYPAYYGEMESMSSFLAVNRRCCIVRCTVFY